MIVGSGPEEPAVREIAEMPNIHHLGRLPHTETIQWIRGSDILVEPSLVTSGLPLTILEAMACGTIVVARDIPAIRGSVGGGAAELFADGSAITGTICSLLDDHPRMDAMAARARAAVSSYDFGVIGRLYLDLYQSLLDDDGEVVVMAAPIHDGERRGAMHQPEGHANRRGQDNKKTPPLL